jgi:hypothetical protein
VLGRIDIVITLSVRASANNGLIIFFTDRVIDFADGFLADSWLKYNYISFVSGGMTNGWLHRDTP